MPPSTPSAADVALVEAAMGGNQPPAAPAQPAPQEPTPTQPQAQPQAQPQMQPAPVTPQPAPTSQPQDPFSAFIQPQPTEPTAPQTPQPTEPSPTPQPPTTPTEPTQPAPSEPPAPAEPIANQSPEGEEQVQSYEEYIDSITKGIGEAPAQPDPSKINPDDPEAIKQFFDEIVNTAVTKAQQATARQAAIQNSERILWDGAFEKYGSLKNNKPLRDMVHSIRMGYFQRGVALTPVQAADKLLDSLGQQYKQGVADNQVNTTIENVQPTGGGTGQAVPTSLDKDDDLLAIQTGGEAALAEMLDRDIKAGRL